MLTLEVVLIDMGVSIKAPDDLAWRQDTG